MKSCEKYGQQFPLAEEQQNADHEKNYRNSTFKLVDNFPLKEPWVGYLVTSYKNHGLGI